MTNVDYVIIGLFLTSAIIGLIRGLLREVIAVLSWVVGLWCAWHYSALLTPYLGGALQKEPLHTWAARGIIFAAALLIGTLIGALVNHFVRLSIFSGFDRLLGFIFGLARAAVIAAVAVLLAQQVRLDTEIWWNKSRLLPPIELLADALRSIVGEAMPGPTASVQS
jgi:membrane protein required for colicin V production